MKGTNSSSSPFSLYEKTQHALELFRSFDNLEGLALALHRQEIKRLGRWVRGFHALSALLSAHRLHIFDLLQKEKSLTLAELKKETGAREKSLKVLLFALEALGLIKMKREQVSLTGFGRLFLGEGAVYSLSSFLEFLSLQFYGLTRLDETIKTGSPVKEADIFKPSPYSGGYLLAVNRFLYYPAKMFFQRNNNFQIRDAIMGSMGVSFAAALYEAHPEVQITFGCLEHLVKEIPLLMEVYGLPDKAVISCSAHRGIPQKDKWGKELFDLVFLTKKFLLRPEEKLGEAFAEKAFQVLTPSGRLVIWETFYPDERKPSCETALFGLQDLMASRGGAFYTYAEMEGLLKKIGFRKIEFQSYESLTGTVEFCVAIK